MGRLVMLEEAFRDSPCGSGQAERGYPPGVFRYELGKRQKRKEMGGRVYGKYGEKQPTADSLQSPVEDEGGTGIQRSAFGKSALGKGVGRSEMAQERRPLSMTTGA